jgi:SAM-dependent methyltransferase
MTAQARDGLIFDDAPWLYDRHRPGYPDTAVAALVELARLVKSSRVLEVGAGTGQLTTKLLDRGLTVTAIEPGARMAVLLRGKLSANPSASVVESRFEEATRLTGTFDAVVSSTAFHWVDPDRRYDLAARVLRDRGSLENHRRLPSARRNALLGEIRRFVTEELGDRFVDRYVTTVCVGRKRG